MYKTLFISLVFVGVAMAAPFTTPTMLADNYSQVTAHRGSSAVTPENTLRSFRQAIIDRAGIAELNIEAIMENSVYDVISAAYPLVNDSFMKLAEIHQK